MFIPQSYLVSEFEMSQQVDFLHGSVRALSAVIWFDAQMAIHVTRKMRLEAVRILAVCSKTVPLIFMKFHI